MENTKYKLLHALDVVLNIREVADIFSDFEDPFSAVAEYFLTSCLKKNFDYVEFMKVSGKVFAEKKQTSRIFIEKEESFVYMSILESIQQFLGNK